MQVLTTERLVLRHLVPEDAPFLVELLNDPDFLRYIGDRGVRNTHDALRYLELGPGASYAKNGYGLYMTALREGDTPLGMCGLVKRDFLPHADLGFAFMKEHRGHGYAAEAAAATLEHARRDFGMSTLAAITTQDNAPSIALLKKLGFEWKGHVSPPPGTETLNLFEVEL